MSSPDCRGIVIVFETHQHTCAGMACGIEEVESALDGRPGTTLTENKGVAVVEAVFPGETEEAIKAREAALRWMVRGLAAQLAIRKVQVEHIQANMRQRRTEVGVLSLC